MLTRDEWLAQFASQIGVEPPSESEAEQLLDLAAESAHASERTAAPIACWIAGRSSLSLPDLLRAAQDVSGQNASA